MNKGGSGERGCEYIDTDRYVVERGGSKGRRCGSAKGKRRAERKHVGWEAKKVETQGK